MPHPFAPLAERVIDALLDSDPLLAQHAGDHRADDRLPDWSADSTRAQIATLRDASHTLAEVDADLLTTEEAVDHALLSRLVDRRLFELEDVRAYEWNPLAHNPGPLLHGLLKRSSRLPRSLGPGARESRRPVAPPVERLESLLARLESVPDALAVASGVLGECPAIHLETAIGQFHGVATLIREEVPALAERAGAGADARVRSARERALAALADFETWLKRRLESGGPGRDPRLGRPLWEARLWHTLDSELSASELTERAWANLDRVAEQIRIASAELVGGDPDDATVRAALARIAADCPDDRTIVGRARDALAEATGFVAAHELVSLVDDPCEVVVMPEFARGVAVAHCDAPGPLETADVPTLYAISPAQAGWSAQRGASYYREYNHQMVRNLTVHEAMPGHFLQLAHSRRHSGSSRVRALCRSGSFVEGWAVYAEELMASHGYGGLPVRLQQLKMQLRMTLNALLDQLVHCEQLTEADGIRLMMERGFQEEGEAAGKWRRALLTATQLSTYFVGYTEVSAIAAARPAGAGVRQWHDAMLSHGSPAPRCLRTLLGL